MSTLPWRRRKKGHGRPRPRSNSAPANISLKVKKQKQWTNQVMQAAVDAVREDRMSVLRASQLYNIPKTTLHDRISGKVLHGSKPDSKPYFHLLKKEKWLTF